MTRPMRRSALLLFCLALGACASDDGAPPAPEHAERRPPRRLPNVFISPAGEPFRAAFGAPYPVEAWFARADADHDGKLTRAEMHADALRFFDKLDANHDGVLDGLEVQDYEQTVAPEILPRIESLHAEEGMDQSLTFGDPNNTDNRPERSRQRAQRPVAPARSVGVQGAAVYSLINTPEPVAAADAQFDGRITRQEFGDAIDRRFDLLDKTSAGYLTLATLPKTPLQTEILKQAKQAKRREHGDRPPPPPD